MTRREERGRDAYLPGMRRTALLRPLIAVFPAVLVARAAVGQAWQRGDVLPLIRRAIANRGTRDVDARLDDWKATAHGVLRFASILDHGGIPVERVIRADELRVEVYGEAPNRSKQIIVAWRDTTFLPNHLVYHRDHLGIVANDFGPVIRLGQGDEVRDVPHPLSVEGLSRYFFAIGDTLTVAGPTGAVHVVAVGVRPIDPGAAGTVGTLYLDVQRAAVVSFRFTFTPASYRDPTVDDITVTLENALQSNTLWLPWRQSILIRRGVPLLDFPVRTVIRADWTIGDYQLGVAPPGGRFAASTIDGPLRPPVGDDWQGSIAARLDALPATDADAALVRQEAVRALAGRALSGLGRWRLFGAGISDLIHVNRVEGITPALGGEVAMGSGVVVRGRVGVGLSDHRAIGVAGFDWTPGGTRYSLRAERTVADVADRPVISGISNSVATLFSGDDLGDYALVDRVMAGVSATIGGAALDVSAGGEWSRSVATAFHPIDGESPANPALGAGGAAVLRIGLARDGPAARRWRVDAEGGAGQVDWGRIALHAGDGWKTSLGELGVALDVGAGTADLPGYRSFVLGGRGTLPGVPFRALGGRRFVRGELSWAIPVPVPTPPVPGSRYATLPSTLAPFVAFGAAGGEEPGLRWRAGGPVQTVVGARLDLWGPLLRVEGGIALRTGNAEITVDVHPDWWPLM